uniref:Uncharacterized protein n=1 Tax=Coturnix japonica TaxID=93934 RepID=A0A8C2T6T4_COTJA
KEVARWEPSNHTNGSSIMPKLFHMYVEQKKTLRFNNHSNPALEMQEEIMASFYILIIVGFFGFLLFVMMLTGSQDEIHTALLAFRTSCLNSRDSAFQCRHLLFWTGAYSPQTVPPAVTN